jgi:hypothetical protein
MIGVKEMLAVRKINSERPLMEEKWCPTQCDDFQRMISLVEDLIATAVASNQSPLQYTMLQQAKEGFINEFLDMCEKYRLVSVAK